MTADAAAATLIDLAARNVLDIEQRGPDVFYVRVRETSAESLEGYERRVLEHLARHARDGIVPAAALTTAVPLAVAGLGVLLAVATLLMAATDWGTAVEVTGPILRLCAFGGEATTSATTSRSTTAPRTGSAHGASTKRSTGGSSRGI